MAQKTLEQLLALGRMPSGDAAGQEFLKNFEMRLKEVKEPLSKEDIVSLASLFGEDDCFGLGWTLLHLLESSPLWPDAEAIRSTQGEWRETMEQRLLNATPAAPPSENREKSYEGACTTEPVTMVLGDVFAKLDELPWDHVVYLPRGELRLASTCLVHGPDDVESDGDDEPEPARKLHLKYGLSIADIQDVRDNMLAQKVPFSLDNLLDACLFYLARDAFKEFKELSP